MRVLSLVTVAVSLTSGTTAAFSFWPPSRKGVSKTVSKTPSYLENIGQPETPEAPPSNPGFSSSSSSPPAQESNVPQAYLDAINASIKARQMKEAKGPIESVEDLDQLKGDFDQALDTSRTFEMADTAVESSETLAENSFVEPETSPSVVVEEEIPTVLETSSESIIEPSLEDEEFLYEQVEEPQLLDTMDTEMTYDAETLEVPPDEGACEEYDEGAYEGYFTEERLYEEYLPEEGSYEETYEIPVDEAAEEEYLIPEDTQGDWEATEVVAETLDVVAETLEYVDDPSETMEMLEMTDVVAPSDALEDSKQHRGRHSLEPDQGFDGLGNLGVCEAAKAQLSMDSYRSMEQPAWTDATETPVESSSTEYTVQKPTMDFLYLLSQTFFPEADEKSSSTNEKSAETDVETSPVAQEKAKNTKPSSKPQKPSGPVVYNPSMEGLFAVSKTSFPAAIKDPAPQKAVEEKEAPQVHEESVSPDPQKDSASRPVFFNPSMGGLFAVSKTSFPAPVGGPAPGAVSSAPAGETWNNRAVAPGAVGSAPAGETWNNGAVAPDSAQNWPTQNNEANDDWVQARASAETWQTSAPERSSFGTPEQASGFPPASEWAQGPPLSSNHDADDWVTARASAENAALLGAPSTSEAPDWVNARASAETWGSSSAQDGYSPGMSEQGTPASAWTQSVDSPTSQYDEVPDWVRARESVETRGSIEPAQDLWGMAAHENEVPPPFGAPRGSSSTSDQSSEIPDWVRARTATESWDMAAALQDSATASQEEDTPPPPEKTQTPSKPVFYDPSMDGLIAVSKTSFPAPISDPAPRVSNTAPEHDVEIPAATQRAPPAKPVFYRPSMGNLHAVSKTSFPVPVADPVPRIEAPVCGVPGSGRLQPPVSSTEVNRAGQAVVSEPVPFDPSMSNRVSKTPFPDLNGESSPPGPVHNGDTLSGAGLSSSEIEGTSLNGAVASESVLESAPSSVDEKPDVEEGVGSAKKGDVIASRTKSNQRADIVSEMYDDEGLPKGPLLYDPYKYEDLEELDALGAEKETDAEKSEAKRTVEAGKGSTGDLGVTATQNKSELNTDNDSEIDDDDDDDDDILPAGPVLYDPNKYEDLEELLDLGSEEETDPGKSNLAQDVEGETGLTKEEGVSASKIKSEPSVDDGSETDDGEELPTEPVLFENSDEMKESIVSGTEIKIDTEEMKLAEKVEEPESAEQPGCDIEPKFYKPKISSLGASSFEELSSSSSDVDLRRLKRDSSGATFASLISDTDMLQPLFQEIEDTISDEAVEEQFDALYEIIVGKKQIPQEMVEKRLPITGKSLPRRPVKCPEETKEMREQLKCPGETKEMAEKYAAIEDVGERAFAILFDLGMIDVHLDN